MSNSDFTKRVAQAFRQHNEQKWREQHAAALLDFTLECIAEVCDTPCDWSINGEGLDGYMFDHCGEWCNENCGKISAAECWRKYIEARFKEDTK